MTPDVEHQSLVVRSSLFALTSCEDGSLFLKRRNVCKNADIDSRSLMMLEGYVERHSLITNLPYLMHRRETVLPGIIQIEK